MNDERARSVWAVLPVKAFARGKSRLGQVLTDPARTAFARELFDHVVSTIAAAPSIHGTIVITDDEQVAERARALSLEIVRDPPAAKLADVVDAGMRAALARGASAALVCMADLPRMTASDVESVVSALRMHPAVVVPDLHEAGTNVLGMAPPLAFPSCFGHRDSFQRHLARAAQNGFTPEVLRLHGLCFDVDGPEDLARIA